VTAHVAGRLVLADRVVPGRVTLDDGRIASIEPRSADSGGPYVSPGFIDAHVHGWGGHDAMGSRDELQAMARALLGHGVTSFLPTAVSAPFERLAAFAATVRSAARVAGVGAAAQPVGFHLEGPFLSPSRAGVHDPSFLRSPAETTPDELDPLLDGLRLMTIAPELAGSIAMIEGLCARGVACSLGHSNATLEEAQAGYRAGARGTTHLFNAMTGVDHHRPGLAVAALRDDAAFVELIADGHHVDRALWPLIARTKPVDRLVLVSDAVSLAGTDRSHGALGGIQVEVVGDRCTFAGGALAGSLIALDTAVANLIASGIAIAAAICAATANPADLLGLDDRGRLEPGRRADLVELDDQFQVIGVLRAGARVELG
jgi:N-acetylglucosamine-6-phosphate deacetylase